MPQKEDFAGCVVSGPLIALSQRRSWMGREGTTQPFKTSPVIPEDTACAANPLGREGEHETQRAGINSMRPVISWKKVVLRKAKGLVTFPTTRTRQSLMLNHF